MPHHSFLPNRLLRHKSPTTFGVTIAGQVLYVVVSPQEVGEIYRNDKTLTFFEYVQDVMRSIGVSEGGIQKSWSLRPALSPGKSERKSLAVIGADFYREQLLPGQRLDALWPRVLASIDESIKWDNVVDSHMTQSRAPSGEKETINISLMEWTREVLLKAVIEGLFGGKMLQLEPRLPEYFIRFDEDSWKLIYKFPKFFARDMYSAKENMIGSVEAYLNLPKEIRSGQAWLINRYEEETAELEIDKHDLAAMIMSLLWVMLSNAYKLCFWMVAYLLFDSELYDAIKAECDSVMNAIAINSPTTVESGNPDLTGLEARLEKDCPRLMSFYHEILRLTTSSTSIRTVKSPISLTGGTHILPPAAKVLLPLRQLHFDKSVFGPNADDFDPDRFLRDPKLSTSPSFRPFGGGSTYCPGRYVARYEVLSFIALILTRLDVRLSQGKDGGSGSGSKTSRGREKRERPGFPRLDSKKPTLGMMMPLAGDDVRVEVRKP